MPDRGGRVTRPDPDPSGYALAIVLVFGLCVGTCLGAPAEASEPAPTTIAEAAADIAREEMRCPVRLVTADEIGRHCGAAEGRIAEHVPAILEAAPTHVEALALVAHAAHESSLRADAVGSRGVQGELGLYQFQRGYGATHLGACARALGVRVNPLDPEQATRCAVLRLRTLTRKARHECKREIARAVRRGEDEHEAVVSMALSAFGLGRWYSLPLRCLPDPRAPAGERCRRVAPVRADHCPRSPRWRSVSKALRRHRREAKP